MESMYSVRAFETVTKDFWMQADVYAKSMNEALRIARNAIPTSPDSPLIYVVETE